MTKFIPKEKLGKKARKALDAQQRTLWAMPPASKAIESKKRYDRKRDARSWKESGAGVLLLVAV